MSIWQDVGGGSFQWFSGMVAGDGTYSFDVPSGTYKVLVQYELAGEQWRGPFAVSSPIPYEDISLIPSTVDSIPPTVQLNSQVGDEITGVAIDALVGLSVVEIVPDSLVNVDVFIGRFDQGADSVSFSVRSADGANPGYVKMFFADQLGNFVEREIILGTPTGAVPGPPSSRTLTLNHYPNPFNPTTTILYAVNQLGIVRLAVYDVQGRVVKRLVDEARSPGIQYRVTWDGKDENGTPVASGVYFLRLESGLGVKTRKMVVLK